jgi:hypothetical protein
MSDTGNNGQGPQRLRVAGAAPGANDPVRAANDPAGPVYAPLPPAGRNALALAFAASAAWIGLVFWYSVSAVGFDAFASMLPHELGAFVGGATMPLLVLGFALGYRARGRDLVRHARAADPENVLVSTFVSSDVGKRYMTLASIVGWKK